MRHQNHQQGQPDQQIVVTIIHIVAAYEERTYAAAKTDDGAELRVIGPPHITVGKRYSLRGRWKDHPKWGRQFLFDVAIEPRPTSRQAAIHYLEKLPGIGPKTAIKLVDACGPAVFDDLMNDHAAVAARIGVKPDRLKDAAEAVRADEKDRQLKIELHDLLDGNGFPKSITHQVIEKWGTRAVDLIRNDPFRLMPFQRIGFALCDAFHGKLGLNPRRLKRQAYAGLYAMAESREGHTWFGVDFWHAAINRLIGFGARPDRALELLVRAHASSNCGPTPKADNGSRVAATHAMSVESRNSFDA